MSEAHKRKPTATACAIGYTADGRICAASWIMPGHDEHMARSFCATGSASVRVLTVDEAEIELRDKEWAL